MFLFTQTLAVEVLNACVTYLKAMSTPLIWAELLQWIVSLGASRKRYVFWGGGPVLRWLRIMSSEALGVPSAAFRFDVAVVGSKHYLLGVILA